MKISAICNFFTTEKIISLRHFLSVLVCVTFTSCTHKNRSWSDQRVINSEQDWQFLMDEAAYIPRRLSLNEIIHIALERNFDLAAKEKEFNIQYQFALRDHFKMLPQLIARGELSQRNNQLIVSSQSTDPSIPPAPPSISTEPHVIRYELDLVLNLLDFGLSYFKARVESTRAFIMALEYQRLTQTLVLEIHKQYWKAAVAKLAMDESHCILDKAKTLQYKIADQITDRDLSKSKGLKFTSDLINLQIQFSGFESDYYKAMTELSVLMGLPSSACFELDEDLNRLNAIELEDICVLETIALQNRPELYVKDAEERISEDEIRYAFLQMLPGIELFAGDYFDANKFFTYHHWIVAGARATWNLFAFPSQYFNNQGYLKRKELARIQRLALSIGVLSQVRLAYILYKENYDQYNLVNSLEITNQKLLASIEAEFNQGAVSESEVIFVTSQALFSKINALKSYGDLQISLEQLNYSIGLPQYYESR